MLRSSPPPKTLFPIPNQEFLFSVFHHPNRLVLIPHQGCESCSASADLLDPHSLPPSPKMSNIHTDPAILRPQTRFLTPTHKSGVPPPPPPPTLHYHRIFSNNLFLPPANPTSSQPHPLILPKFFSPWATNSRTWRGEGRHFLPPTQTPPFSTLLHRPDFVPEKFEPVLYCFFQDVINGKKCWGWFMAHDTFLLASQQF